MIDINVRLIVKYKDDSYYFADEPDWSGDWDKNDPSIIGWYELDKIAGFHDSEKSALYDDMTGFHDEVTVENNLPNLRFVVAYFKHTDSAGLDQCVDFDISKDQIIQNVRDQKYVEGAAYYLLDALKPINTLNAA